MIVHEYKNKVSTVRIHDEYCEADSKRLVSSVGRVVSDSYKRRYISELQEASGMAVLSEHQPTGAAPQT